MKLAAADLLNIILPDSMPEGKARVALVPFANYVNAGTFASDVTGLDPTKTQSNVTQMLVTCVTERNGNNDYSDAAPNNGSYVGSFAQGNSGNNYSADGVCYRDNNGNVLPPVMPLTSDRSALLDAVNSFTPAGSTAGHLGTAWAWYMLAPSWNSDLEPFDASGRLQRREGLQGRRSHDGRLLQHTVHFDGIAPAGPQSCAPP